MSDLIAQKNQIILAILSQANKKIVHQLNNQGCRCQMCQKLIHKQNMKIKMEQVSDFNSQGYNSSIKQYYITIIRKLYLWNKKSRKFRYVLPQICIYENAKPIERIGKRKEHGGLVYIHDKAKMHMFEIIHFFLDGFIHHKESQITTDYNQGKKQKKDEQVVGIYSEKYKNQCIVIAKYKNNFFNMFTLAQMESLFKSRQRYLRQGLMYLQTIVGDSQNSQIRVNIDVRNFMGTEIYERAKNQVRMILQEIKPVDMDFIPQEQQIKFEKAIRRKNHRDYLEYLSLKIILMASKNQELTMSKATFKYIKNKGMDYLWDLRVEKMQPTDQFWAVGVMKAFQLRLHRRMSMIDMDPRRSLPPLQKPPNSRKTEQLAKWLTQSTQMQWKQMGLIKNRLQKLQRQKKSLIQSQSFAQGENRQFKIRSMRK